MDKMDIVRIQNAEKHVGKAMAAIERIAENTADESLKKEAKRILEACEELLFDVAILTDDEY